MEIHTPADFSLHGFTDGLDIISEEEAKDILLEASNSRPNATYGLPLSVRFDFS